MLRIFGIDPGSHRTGWGVIDAEGTRFKRVASGTLVAKKGSLSSRLCQIADGIDKLIANYEPTSGAIESIFHAKNSQSALKLGHARGVALLCMARFDLEISEYSPTQVKQAMTGAGRASKEQLAQMIKMILAKLWAFGELIRVVISFYQF